jgi:protein-S-isoprenylcysteine O-methyltransferase Ste14
MRTSRVIFGMLVSVAFLVLIPVAYWWLARMADSSFHAPSALFTRPVELIMTGTFWSLGLFWILWSYSYLVFVGSGSPVEAFGLALHPTQTLVTAGPYAYLRNPMVFGFLFILLGTAFLADSVCGLVLTPICWLLAALYLKAFEEKGLVRRFGAAFEHYRAKVPLLLPRLTPYVPPEVNAKLAG